MDEGVADDVFVLVPRPPLRAYALAGLIAAAGALLSVMAAASGWGVGLVVLGLAVLVAGVALLGVAAAAAARMRVRVALTEAGYHVTGPGGERSGTWADVQRITLAADGNRLTLHHAADRRTLLVTPRGAHDPELERLGEAMGRHLDADRGYRRVF